MRPADGLPATFVEAKDKGDKLRASYTCGRSKWPGTTLTKWLSYDYVKFIHQAQHFIEKNGEGRMAYISPRRHIPVTPYPCSPTLPHVSSTYTRLS